MKKKFFYIIVASLFISFSNSCTKSFLKEESFTEIGKDKYMRNAEEAKVVLLGVYRDMVPDAMYGYHMSILLNLGTDISQVEGSTSDNFRIIPTNSFSSNQAEIEQTWRALYKAIYDANDFIEGVSQKVDGYSEPDKELANVYVAEARGLRALFYFELLRRYGHIALITSTTMSNQLPSTFEQEDPAKVYEYIEEDLKFAADNLPYATDDKIRGDNSFRFSKGAALGLLTKVYATWAGYPVRDESKWEEAANTAKVLINSNKHNLLPDYEQLWKNSGAGRWDPTESLIEVSFYSPTASKSSDPVGRIGKWNGVSTTAIAGVRGRNAANVKVVHPFVLDWRKYPGDFRRDISVANYRYNPGKELWVHGSNTTEADDLDADADSTKQQSRKQNYTPGKWDTEKYVPEGNNLVDNNVSNINWYILRYSDVLLLYAEALNEWKHGPNADAYAAVNKVRERGFGGSSAGDLAQGLTEEQFRNAVHKERAFELAFEGERKWDLIRWGVYYETVRATAIRLGSWWTGGGSFNYLVGQPGHTTKGKHELLPIPLREMDLMPQFQQNPNW